MAYASTYEETFPVAAAANAGATWKAFRHFLACFRAVRARRALKLLVKLRPSTPAEDAHRAILREEGVEADAIVAKDPSGTALAASDLLVSYFPSQVMIDCLMVNTPCLWVKGWFADLPFYEDAPWLMRTEMPEMTDVLLERAATDEAHRARFVAMMEAWRPRYNLGEDGRATERLLEVIDRMCAASTVDADWSRFFDGTRQALQIEGQVLAGLRTLCGTLVSNTVERKDPAV